MTAVKNAELTGLPTREQFAYLKCTVCISSLFLSCTVTPVGYPTSLAGLPAFLTAVTAGSPTFLTAPVVGSPAFYVEGEFGRQDFDISDSGHGRLATKLTAVTVGSPPI